MYRRENVTYLYDASFEGFLCCVHESVYAREIPAEIVTQESYIPSFFTPRLIYTDEKRAAKVYASLESKISADAKRLVERVFLSCMEQKELSILLFLLWAYREGARAMRFLSHPLLQPLLAADKYLYNESHLFLEFLRFEDVGGALVAVIEPNNFVLPFLREHFCSRFAIENFLIYDKTHGAALIWQDGKAEIRSLDALTLPPATITETRYRNLWKQFYKTVSIEARENPRGRMTHCAKRYWEHMCEMPRA